MVEHGKVLVDIMMQYKTQYAWSIMLYHFLSVCWKNWFKNHYSGQVGKMLFVWSEEIREDLSLNIVKEIKLLI